MARYKVIGNHKVAGVALGGTVELDDNPQTAALIAAGHVRPYTPKSKPETPKVAD